MRVVRTTAMLALAAATVAACNRRVEVVSGGEVAPVTPSSGRMMPVGSTLQVRLNNTLSTESSKAGDGFTATVTQNLVAQNGEVVVPAGAVIHGRVTGVNDSDNPTERALLRLAFEHLVTRGKTYDFGASVVSVAAVEQRNPSTGKVIRDAAVGAAVGGAIGAIVSGAELDNILKGGLLGAGIGTVISMGVGDVDHVIPSGTAMTIRSTQQVNLR